MKKSNFYKKNFMFSAICAVILLFSACQKNEDVSPASTSPTIQKKEISTINFSIDATINGNENSGTFTSSGDVTTNGSFSETYKYKGGKYKSDVTFTDENGTITVKVDGDIVFSDESNATGSSTWRVKSGTGAYENFYSEGTLTLIIADHTSAGSGTITQNWVSN